MNGLAERFVQTMKQTLKSSQGNGSLNRLLNTFLLTYRNTPHATTKVAPASAMKKRQLRTRLNLLRPPKTRQVVQTQQRAQVERRSKAKDRSFIAGEREFLLGTTAKVRNGYQPEWLHKQGLCPTQFTHRITSSGGDTWINCCQEPTSVMTPVK
jgi:hypothetical protein